MKTLIVFILATLWLSSINPAQAQNKSDSTKLSLDSLVAGILKNHKSRSGEMGLSGFIAQNKPALLGCFDAQKKALKGIIFIELIIRPDGGVANAAVRESTVKSDNAERCLLVKFKTAMFSKTQLQEMRRAMVTIWVREDNIEMFPFDGETLIYRSNYPFDGKTPNPEPKQEQKNPFRLLENYQHPN